MNCLLVDDEPGIREGLAALLRRRGHEVSTAASVGAALAQLREQQFDVVITDWRLPDGIAEPVVAAARCPVIAASGHPEEVTRHANLAQVLTKPVGPTQLLECMAAVAAPAPAAAAVALDPLAGLPIDTRSCIAAGLALLAADGCELLDDGAFVTLRCPLPGDHVLPALEQLGGDLRVLAPDGRPTVEWRLHRDARPDGLDVVDTAAAWPEAVDLAVDFDRGPPCSPPRFAELLQQSAAATAAGRTVQFLNVPEHLRFFAEVSGRGHDMPKRTSPGPRLAAVLVDLWS